MSARISKPLRAVTYNVHSCIGLDRVLAPERILRVLHEIDADIVALQELGCRRQGAADQFPLFASALGMEGVYDIDLLGILGRFGNALFVRGRLIEAKVIDLSVGRYEPRRVLDALVELHGERMRVMVTHLGLRPLERRRQIERIAAAMDDDSAPTAGASRTLLLGDFNVVGPERRALGRLGAPRGLKRMPTYPAWRPIMSLDRLWTVPASDLIGLHVHRSALSRVASDHLPLVGEIKHARR